ncbi:MAG: glycosyltransferase [bacterium]|nr:glycosyltransferase [bacterium]
MISFIFPAYNEAENLKRFPEEVFPVFDALQEPYEIIVIDDGSDDETAVVARRMGDRIRLVVHEQNKGLGAAIRTGIDAVRGDIVITMDTDLTFAPELVFKLLERYHQNDVDVVSGSPKLAGYGSDIPIYRILVSKMASIVYRVIMGGKVTTVSPIFRLYKREHLTSLPLRSTGFDINAEILFYLIRDERRIIEIPTPLTQRVYGESKLVYSREMKRHIRLLFHILRIRLSNKKV